MVQTPKGGVHQQPPTSETHGGRQASPQPSNASTHLDKYLTELYWPRNSQIFTIQGGAANTELETGLRRGDMSLEILADVPI